VAAVYGGAPIEKQTSEINRGVAIIVATPGRLIDLMERKAISLRDL
jgi:superfamily II DNA/RNA helicase